MAVRYEGAPAWKEGGPLSADAWRHYAFEWTFNPLMAAGAYEFGVGFRTFPAASDPVNGQSTGFLDNVTLVQTPEPASGAVAVGLIAAARGWRE